MNEEQQAIDRFIWIKALGGYDNVETIIQETMDTIDENRHEWLTFVRDRTTEYLERHIRQQKTWDYTTDCDRLDEAFAELDRIGIVARQNFTCCQTCGHGQIGDEMLETLQYRSVRGYVFFHQQDVEHAVEHDTLFLAYGSYEGNEESSVAIGHEVVNMLRKHGLRVTWDGFIQKRIKIHPLKWQRRRIIGW